MSLYDRAWQALRDVRYPGYSRDIVSFGLAKHVDVAGDRVRVVLGVGHLPEDARATIMAEEAVMEFRDRLPVHEEPMGARGGPGHTLRVGGLVARPLVLGASDLAPLRREERTETFTCEEGWSVPGLRWRGIRLGDIVALAGPLPSARYIRVCAGDYAVPVSLEEAERALLCDALNGRPLARAHGAPWRLLLPGRECFTSVKWVDRLEVTPAPGPEDGARIARARLRRTRGDRRAADRGRAPARPVAARRSAGRVWTRWTARAAEETRGREARRDHA